MDFKRRRQLSSYTFFYRVGVCLSGFSCMDNEYDSVLDSRLDLGKERIAEADCLDLAGGGLNRGERGEEKVTKTVLLQLRQESFEA